MITDAATVVILKAVFKLRSTDSNELLVDKIYELIASLEAK